MPVIIVNCSPMPHCSLERLAYPGVEALALELRRNGDGLVELGGKANDEFAGKRLVRFLAALSAPLQIVGNRRLELFAQFGHGGTLKGNDITNAEHLTVEQVGFIVELDSSLVAFIFHYGFTGLSLNMR
jgi:hypothetical protein